MQTRYLIIALIILLIGALAASYYLKQESTSSGHPPASSPAKQVRKTIYLDLAYTEHKTSPSQSLDLYLPENVKQDYPLFVYIPGGFWAEPDQGFRLSQQNISTLTRQGMAVAHVRFRPAPDHQHPNQVNDVAAALAYLFRQAGSYGYNPQKIYLAGHSSGGHLVALLNQDAQYLNRYDMKPGDLAGVIIISGIFDVTEDAVLSPKQAQLYEDAFGTQKEVRIQASPLAYRHAKLPPTLILSAEADLPGFSINARHYMQILRDSGNQETYYHVMRANTHLSMIMLDNADNRTLQYILAYMGLGQQSEGFLSILAARKHWHDPPLSTEPFWRNKKLITSHPVDQRFADSLIGFFQNNSYMLHAWPLQQFHAIDLFAYLDSINPDQLGQGPFLTTTNMRGERRYLDLEQLRPYKPVIVVGLDDEQNLFRLTQFYRTKRQYSWLENTEPQPLSVRPVGAFVYFLEPPPAELFANHFSFYSLTHDSFSLSADNPLEWIKQLPQNLQTVFTNESGCVSCHAFKDMNARSHHVNAMTLEPHGGFAIPLTSYPDTAWSEFVFNQVAVADKMGVTPNNLPDDIQQPLYDLIVEARGNQELGQTQ